MTFLKAGFFLCVPGISFSGGQKLVLKMYYVCKVNILVSFRTVGIKQDYKQLWACISGVTSWSYKLTHKS